MWFIKKKNLIHYNTSTYWEMLKCLQSRSLVTACTAVVGAWVRTSSFPPPLSMCFPFSHSSVLAWRIRGAGEPDGLPSMGSHRVGHDWSDLAAAAAWIHLPGPYRPLSLTLWPRLGRTKPFWYCIPTSNKHKKTVNVLSSKGAPNRSTPGSMALCRCVGGGGGGGGLR